MRTLERSESAGSCFALLRQSVACGPDGSGVLDQEVVAVLAGDEVMATRVAAQLSALHLPLTLDEDQHQEQHPAYIVRPLPLFGPQACGPVTLHQVTLTFQPDAGGLTRTVREQTLVVPAFTPNDDPPAVTQRFHPRQMNAFQVSVMRPGREAAHACLTPQPPQLARVPERLHAAALATARTNTPTWVTGEAFVWLLPSGEVMLSHPPTQHTVAARQLRKSPHGLAWGQVVLPHPEEGEASPASG